MYSLLRDIKLDSGMLLTYISVGHRPSLLNYHDVRLRLSSEEGRHEVESIDKVQYQNVAAKNM